MLRKLPKQPSNWESHKSGATLANNTKNQQKYLGQPQPKIKTKPSEFVGHGATSEPKLCVVNKP
jgi:hypothetical protein